jgi:hypothetical protein
MHFPHLLAATPEAILPFLSKTALGSTMQPLPVALLPAALTESGLH